MADTSPVEIPNASNVLTQGLLQQAYILESRPETESFLLLRPAAVDLLLEASAHIDEAFGAGRVKAVRLVHDDVEGTSVFGIVFWPESAESGKEALARFDEDWWLQNCNQAEW
jgi:hypothetical protein